MCAYARVTRLCVRELFCISAQSLFVMELSAISRVNGVRSEVFEILTFFLVLVSVSG